jgi:hypothetical protein
VIEDDILEEGEDLSDVLEEYMEQLETSTRGFKK